MVELLIPAQNKKSVQAAIGHADAIYFGTETFNMRMHAKNITQADLPEFIQFCHDNHSFKGSSFDCTIHTTNKATIVTT